MVTKKAEVSRVAADSESMTELLEQWRAGSAEAFDRLVPIVYGELRRLARRHMRNERAGHTLQTTALVHEAYQRLVGMELSWKDRAHFFAMAATTMRRILVEHARSRARVKRGDGAVKLGLDDALLVTPESSGDLLLLDRALDRLAEVDARKSRTVELHYFGGLSYDEIAEAQGISTATVFRDLQFAKAWLAWQLRGDDEPHGP